MKTKGILLFLCVSLFTACSYYVGSRVSFDEWDKVKWDHTGTVYLLEEEGRGQVLCLGGTGQALPAGSDEVGIGLDVPKEGGTVSFDYKVEHISPNAFFVVIATQQGKYFPSEWLRCDEETPWRPGTFLAAEGEEYVRLLFKAERKYPGSEGVVICIDNFSFVPASDKDAKPTPIESLD